MFPPLSGGEHKTISLQPAIEAGTASIKTVENKGAVPPGIYKPTFELVFLANNLHLQSFQLQSDLFLSFMKFLNILF
jgi:hypothetical protein